MLTNRHPIDREIHVEGLQIEGRLPPGLRGTLYRNGPNPRPGEPERHRFLGSGMVHAVSLRGRRSAYRNRWIAPADAPHGAANTHVISHAGRMFALEEAHAPMALVPRTLEPGGGGLDIAPFTAHPKHDPETGELVFFGYAADGLGSRTIRCGALGADGNLRWQTRFDAPFCSMVHDMGATPRHVVLPVLPLVGAPDGTGAVGFTWRPELGGHLAVLSRGGDGRDVCWYEAPAVYAFHVANAWEERDRLFLNLFVYDAPPLFPSADGAIAKGRAARPYRWSVSLARRGPIRVEPLHELAGEFPRIDDRAAGRRHGATYCAERTNPDRTDFQGIARLGTDSLGTDSLGTDCGTIDRFDFGSNASVSEPIFVPRALDAPRDDGWLLALAWRPDWSGSRLAVFDAAHVSHGPLAAIHLPHRVPDGFHGSFLPDVFLATDSAR